VEKVCVFLAGMVVLRAIIAVATWPAVLDAQREPVSRPAAGHQPHLTLEHATLHGGADRDDFVGVHALVRGLAAEIFRDVDDLLGMRVCRRRARARRSAPA